MIWFLFSFFLIAVVLSSHAAVHAVAFLNQQEACEHKEFNRSVCDQIGCCQWKNDQCLSFVDIDFCYDDINDNGAVSSSSGSSRNTTSNRGDQCDEAKCVTSHANSFHGSFTCYSGRDKNGLQYIPMCADGYLPKFVTTTTNNSTKIRVAYNDNDGDTDYDTDYDGEGYWKYFTCCPPTLATNDTHLQRHCSNPIIVDGTVASTNHSVMDCRNNSRQPYMRSMKNHAEWSLNTVVQSFICCDSILDNDNNNNKAIATFLNETECVPYSTSNYNEAIKYPNEYATLRPFFCNQPEIGFQYPKYDSEKKNTTNNNYECCKTDHGTKPFTEDRVFFFTVYPQIILSLAAVISCTIVIIALLIPLIGYLNKQQQHKRRTLLVGTVPTTASTISASEPTYNYSSYTLYLLYLAIPDLIINLYILLIYCRRASQKFDPNISGFGIGAATYGIIWNDGLPFEYALIEACSALNLYLSVVLSFEIYLLLKSIGQVRRHKPPSLMKVTIHAAGVLIFSIVIFCTFFFLGQKSISELNELNNDEGLMMNNIQMIISITVTYTIPVVSFFSILIMTKVRNYMPSLSGREKELVRI